MIMLLITLTVLLSLSLVVDAQETTQTVESKQNKPVVYGDPTYEKMVQAILAQRGYDIFVYPEEVYFGDPIYIVIHLKNISEEPIECLVNGYTSGAFWLTLHSESILVPYYLLHESSSFVEERDHGPPYGLSQTLQPGDSQLVFVAYQELPALEDMDHPFWEEAKKRLSVGENIVAHITAESSRDIKKKPEPDSIYVSNSVLIKPRPAMEMELLERWREGTPEWLLPVPRDQMFVQGSYMKAIYRPLMINDPEFDPRALVREPGFVSKARSYKIYRNDLSYFPSKECFIKVRGQDYFPFIFLRQGNRKPGDPVCPMTWQGWKELEESLSPSTMRDEIRMTRILIQYCDTEDKAVLKELKDWFATMNEVQRTVMARLLHDRIDEYSSKCPPQFWDVYYAINEYDVVPVHENQKRSLEYSRVRRQLELLLERYRGTEADTLPEELKKWFADMNEVQRNAIAEYVRYEAEKNNTEKTTLRLREFYKTIREYDVKRISESDKERLRNFGLIE